MKLYIFCTYEILQLFFSPNKLGISLASFKPMTCLPPTAVDFPLWAGYWHDLGGRQNFPKECLCLGQIDIISICDSVTENKTALAKISPFSVRLSVDKWQLMRCPPISSLQSLKRNNVSRPRLAPQSPFTISWKEHNFDDSFITWKQQGNFQ